MGGGNETEYKSIVMSPQLTGATGCGVCGHQGTESPFVHCTRILLIDCRRYERFHDEPTTEVDANIDFRNFLILECWQNYTHRRDRRPRSMWSSKEESRN